MDSNPVGSSSQVSCLNEGLLLLLLCVVYMFHLKLLFVNIIEPVSVKLPGPLIGQDNFWRRRTKQSLAALIH